MILLNSNRQNPLFGKVPRINYKVQPMQNIIQKAVIIQCRHYFIYKSELSRAKMTRKSSFLSRNFAIDGVYQLVATCAFPGELLWVRTDHLDDGANVPGHLGQRHEWRESSGKFNRIQRNEQNVKRFAFLLPENASKPCMCGRSAPRWGHFGRTARLPLSTRRPHRRKPSGNLHSYRDSFQISIRVVL